MINILFVDDEPNILEGLQRMLRPLRHEWQMSFANSGAEALALFENEHIDVVVSDMKMPGMDGSELLYAIMQKYPHVIRIILSGYSEKEMVIKTVGTAHQYLSKPCDADILKATVMRVSALRDLLTDETLRRLVSQLPSIPSLPLLYTELIDELGKNEPSTRTVGEIVKKDIGMTVKILQIVNSAFFGLRRRL
ncbi:MAG TPA: response regulator, partial [Pyrinomonadaceae bacterium]|nr:response regulator [Pyrinomonadaceae bacterium]